MWNPRVQSTDEREFLEMSKMSKINISLPASPDGDCITAEQVAAVYQGCLKTLECLGDLASMVNAIRVKFVRVAETNTFGPSFEIFHTDPLGNEVWHSSSYRFMGVRGEGKDGNPNPSAEEIVDHFCGPRGVLPAFIRVHLARGAKKLAEVNASFKRLGNHEGFRLVFSDYSETNGGKLPLCFRADSPDAALRYVARVLRISYPISEKAFREAGGVVVLRNFTRQLFPPKKK